MKFTFDRTHIMISDELTKSFRRDIVSKIPNWRGSRSSEIPDVHHERIIEFIRDGKLILVIIRIIWIVLTIRIFSDVDHRYRVSRKLLRIYAENVRRRILINITRISSVERQILVKKYHSVMDNTAYLQNGSDSYVLTRGRVYDKWVKVLLEL